MKFYKCGKNKKAALLHKILKTQITNKIREVVYQLKRLCLAKKSTQW